MKRKEVYIFVLLFIVLIAFRFSTNIENIVTIGGSSIATIPWSDAAGWTGGSECIQRGEVMPEFPSRRPLYPAFLSLLFALTGGTYLAAIICQVVLFSSALIACFYLLRNSNEKYAVAFFLACLSLWLPSTQSLFLTENLGAILLIVSFGFLWRGVLDGSSEFYATGLFLLSLSFSARPWAAGCLLTLPLLPFTINKKITYNDNAKQFLFFSFMIVSGLAINLMVSALFATSATASNYPQTLYGLVSNTLSWRAASLDPVIAQHMQDGTAPALLNTIIYQRCWEIFIANPLLLLFSLREVYILYFTEIPSAFAYNTYLYPVMMVLWFILVSRHKKINKIRCLILLLPTVLNLGSFVFMFLAFYGTFLFFTRRQQNTGAFGLLYMLGILASLPLVGIDGGSRVKIASDIFLFFLCAFGLQHFLHPIQEIGAAGFNDKQRNMVPLAALSVCFVSFVFFPWLIFLNGKRQNQYIAQESLPVQTKRLPLQVPFPDALSNLKMDTIGKKWPDPSYETVDGKAAYRLIRYTDRDALFLDHKQWVSVQLAEFWPMGKFDPPMARTVHVRSWCIFPNMRKESLKKFDKSHIYVAGRIIGLPRQWKYDTGYALLVSHIGVIAEDNTLAWQEISSLAH